MKDARNKYAQGYKQIAILMVGAALVSGIGITAASYTDSALVNLGGKSGIGSTHLFAVEVKNDSGEWTSAPTEGEAVTLRTSPDSVLRIDETLEYSATTRIAPDSPMGDIVPRIYKSSSCVEQCAALYDFLVFDVYYDGEKMFSSVTAESFNSSDSREILRAQPGEEHRIALEIKLRDSVPIQMNGASGMFGVSFEGMSRSQ